MEIQNILEEKGQATTEYAILMVLLAITLIPVVYGFREGWTNLLRQGKLRVEAKGTSSSHTFSFGDGQYFSTSKLRIPAWGSSESESRDMANSALKSIWKLNWDPQNGEQEEYPYQPAQ
ncbi:MAG: hypothetical protein D6785_06335 [Planctomycetota bacterium]|nr:MAG: hypothetical protein D6785_06335 [Planctomycetota bacterium]